MKKILSLTLVAILSLALAAPVSAGMGHGGGFHGGVHGGFHHGGFHHFGCCFGPAFVGGVFVGSALASPYYTYPYAAYPVYPAPVYDPAPLYQPQTPVSVAPSVQREVCYTSGCYQLRGDGVTVAYAWIWVPAPPAVPRLRRAAKGTLGVAPASERRDEPLPARSSVRSASVGGTPL